MIKLMCEQMYSGLENLVNRVLNEKQEISPEDQRDNELIRSAMRKRQNRSNAKLSKDELDALKRNGWDVREKRFNTANGHVYVGGWGEPTLYNSGRSDYRDSNKRRAMLTTRSVRKRNPVNKENRWDDANYERIEPNVNFADMGRKQADRKPVGRVTRYSKKNDGYYNYQNAYRKENAYPASTKKYRDAIDYIKTQKDCLGYINKNIGRAYSDVDKDRERYLQQIAYYKDLLKNLDAEVESKVSSLENDSKETREYIDSKMNSMRDEFKNRKR